MDKGMTSSMVAEINCLAPFAKKQQLLNMLKIVFNDWNDMDNYISIKFTCRPCRNQNVRFHQIGFFQCPPEQIEATYRHSTVSLKTWKKNTGVSDFKVFASYNDDMDEIPISSPEIFMRYGDIFHNMPSIDIYPVYFEIFDKMWEKIMTLPFEDIQTAELVDCFTGETTPQMAASYGKYSVIF